MKITKYTYCGKKDATKPEGYSRVKVWSSGVANDLQIGHHRATLGQLNAKGYMVYAETVYDPTTEKLALVFSDDGSIISKAKIDLSAEEIAANAAAAVSGNVSILWQAAHDYEYEQISGSAIGLIAIGLIAGLPKAVAVQGWVKSIWALYYTRKAEIQGGGVADNDFTSCGDIPHTVPELMEEAGV